MSGNPQVVEQAQPLAPPSENAETERDAEIIDLDAGESLLDERPDDGGDTPGDEPSPSDKTTEPEAEASGESEGEPEEDEDRDIAALTAEPEKPEKRPSGSARLKAQLAEAQAEIERLRKAVPKTDEAADLAAAVERELGPPPKEDEYEDYLAFQEAKTAYRTASMLVGRELKQAAEASKRQVEQRNNDLVAEFRERAHEVRKLVKDFDAVIGSTKVIPQHPDVLLAIVESEKGPHIAYYLGKRPDKVRELDQMPVTKALKEIGRLEARLTPAPKKETRAPAPVPSVKGGTKTTEVDPDNLSQEDFNKWYDERKRRGG